MDPDPDPIDPQPDPDPVPDPDPIPAVQGSYRLVSAFEVPLTVLAPDPLNDAYVTLRGLRDDPAATLIDLLHAAGVPLIDTVYDNLPDSLRAEVDAQINEYFMTTLIGERTLSEEIALIVDAATITLTRFDLMSDLTLAPAAEDGSTLATHEVRGIHYQMFGNDTTVELPPELADRLEPVVMRSDVDALVSVDELGTQSLALGDHTFGLPLGDYAFAALNKAMEQAYGGDLRTSLGTLVDCPAMAKSVADICLGPVCVGHESDWLELCNTGLDKVVDKIRERFAEHNIDVLFFHEGQAIMMQSAGTDGSAVIESLTEGVWQAAIDASLGEREVFATFQGDKL